MFLREVKRSIRPTAKPSAQTFRICSAQEPIQGLRLVELVKRGARFFPPWTPTKMWGKAESLVSVRIAVWVWYRSNRISYQSSLTIVQEDRNDRSGLDGSAVDLSIPNQGKDITPTVSYVKRFLAKTVKKGSSKPMTQAAPEFGADEII